MFKTTPISYYSIMFTSATINIVAHKIVPFLLAHLIKLMIRYIERGIHKNNQVGTQYCFNTSLKGRIF